MSYLAKDKWVRIMTDYASDGLWAKNGCGVDADSLPVSPTTRERLSAWCDKFQSTQFYLPPDQREKNEFDVIAHGSEGRAIARLVKSELPDWTVVYFDKAVYKIVGSDAPRGCYEYEVVSVGK